MSKRYASAYSVEASKSVSMTQMVPSGPARPRASFKAVNVFPDPGFPHRSMRALRWVRVAGRGLMLVVIRHLLSAPRRGSQWSRCRGEGARRGSPRTPPPSWCRSPAARLCRDAALLTPDTSPTRASTAIRVRSWGQCRLWGEHLARACLHPHHGHGDHPDLARPRVDHLQRRLGQRIVTRWDELWLDDVPGRRFGDPHQH